MGVRDEFGKRHLEWNHWPTVIWDFLEVFLLCWKQDVSWSPSIPLLSVNHTLVSLLLSQLRLTPLSCR